MESKKHIFATIYFNVEEDEVQGLKVQEEAFQALKEVNDKNPHITIYIGAYQGETTLPLDQIQTAVEDALGYLAREVDIYGKPLKNI